MENTIKNNKVAFIFEDKETRQDTVQYSNIFTNIFGYLKRSSNDIIVISSNNRISEIYEIAISCDTIIKVIPTHKVKSLYENDFDFKNKIIIIEDFLSSITSLNCELNRVLTSVKNNAARMIMINYIDEGMIDKDILDLMNCFCEFESYNKERKYNKAEINDLIGNNVCVYTKGNTRYELIDEYFSKEFLVPNEIAPSNVNINKEVIQRNDEAIIDDDIANFLSQESNKSVQTNDTNPVSDNIEKETENMHAPEEFSIKIDELENHSNSSQFYTGDAEKKQIKENKVYENSKQKSQRKYGSANTAKNKEVMGNYNLTIILVAALGFFGAHRFVNGKVKTGLLMIITLGGCGIWWIIDIIVVATENFRDIDNVKIKREKPVFKNVGDIVAIIILTLSILMSLTQ